MDERVPLTYPAATADAETRLAASLGIAVSLCGDDADGTPLTGSLAVRHA